MRVLRGAFLKVEDLSRAYKPLVLEMKKWPRPLCHASHKASPFDPPQLSRSPQQQKRKEGGGGGCDKVEVREKRPGHCECCCVRFEDLHMVSATTYMFCIDPQLDGALYLRFSSSIVESVYLFQMLMCIPIKFSLSHSTCAVPVTRSMPGMRRISVPWTNSLLRASHSTSSYLNSRHPLPPPGEPSITHNTHTLHTHTHTHTQIHRTHTHTAHTDTNS